jgi:phosphoribosylformylglycinamidine synthase
MPSTSVPKVGLVQFLGSNCDQDCIDAFARNFGIDVKLIWHTETTLPKLDGLILPGGFSYGDFLRSGALAAHTKIMRSVRQFAEQGGAIIGICNGFQILTESQILPGALIRNTSGQFVCETSALILAEGNSGYHRALTTSKSLQIPIAHGEGRYHIGSEGLKRLQDGGQILFKYANNPNGSISDIAGVISGNGRVLGMMPHPERAALNEFNQNSDGIAILRAFLEACL